MGEEFSIKGINKFDGTNFMIWKFQVTQVLVALGIKEYVIGDEKRPTDSTEAKAWDKNNARAMVVLSSAMTNDQLEFLITCETAKSMWEKLCLIHEERSETNKLSLLQKFHRCDMQQNESVIVYISRIQNLVRQLKDISESVTDAAMMAKVLGGLPEKYGPFSTAWDSVEPARQTLSYLQERLLKEEKRLASEGEVMGAFSSMTNENFKGQDRGQIECFYCHRKGHIKRNCRKWLRNHGRMDEEKQRTPHQGNSNVNTSADSNHSKSSFSGAFISTVITEAEANATYEACRELSGASTGGLWLTDSGATCHMTFRRDWLQNFTAIREGVRMGDNCTRQAEGVGTIKIKRCIHGKWFDGTLENVLYVPSFRKNLFSTNISTERGLRVVFEDNHVELQMKETGEVVAQGVKYHGNICCLFFKVVTAEANLSDNTIKDIHEKLGHVNEATIKRMIQKKSITGTGEIVNGEFFCEGCQYGKMHRITLKPNQESIQNKIEVGESIHVDLCGPMGTSLGGSKFFMLLKDRKSGYRHVYFLKHKSDAFARFKEFHNMMTSMNKMVKVLRCDNGLEFQNATFKEYLVAAGIRLCTSAPYCPQQNGMIERDNRTIVESARSMIHAKGAPQFLWSEAVNTAVYALNRTTSGTQSITPYEKWYGSKPDIGHMQPFWTPAFAHIPSIQRTKFDAKANKTWLVGYQEGCKNYRLYDPNKKKIVIARDVFFDTHSNNSSDILIKVSNTSSVQTQTDEGIMDTEQMSESIVAMDISENEESHPENQEPTNCAAEDQQMLEKPMTIANMETALCKRKRKSMDCTIGTPNLRDRSKIKRPKKFEANFVVIDEPSTIEEALRCSEEKEWKDAIQDELQSHQKNQTWEIVERPQGVDLLDTKWVFKVQRSSTGNVKRFKARLCARGFKQRQGIDYEETYAPVVKYESLRILFAIAAHQDLNMVQFDIKTAFLYGKLEEEIYIKIPPGLQVQHPEFKVCKLRKALYGLKQASRCWNIKFTEFLNKFGFVKCECEWSVYVCRCNQETLYLALFVDDGMIFGKNVSDIEKVTSALMNEFDVKIGSADMFVGIQIERNRNTKTIFLHQEAYAKRILNKFNMDDAIPRNIPADPNTKLCEPSEKVELNVPYREAIGSLMFLVNVSRPDLAFIVNYLSRFVCNFDKSHWEAVKRVMKYLVDTCHYGIEYRANDGGLHINAYSDSNFASGSPKFKSTSGGVMCLASGPVIWIARKQSVVAMSTTEAEYIAASTMSREIIWVRMFLQEIGYPCIEPTILRVDNRGAIQLAKYPSSSRSTKHIKIHYHFIRHQIEAKEIDVQYISTDYQLADLFTKCLPCERFHFLRKGIGMK